MLLNEQEHRTENRTHPREVPRRETPVQPTDEQENPRDRHTSSGRRSEVEFAPIDARHSLSLSGNSTKTLGTSTRRTSISSNHFESTNKNSNICSNRKTSRSNSTRPLSTIELSTVPWFERRSNWYRSRLTPSKRSASTRRRRFRTSLSVVLAERETSSLGTIVEAIHR